MMIGRNKASAKAKLFMVLGALVLVIFIDYALAASARHTPVLQALSPHFGFRFTEFFLGLLLLLQVRIYYLKQTRYRIKRWRYGKRQPQKRL